MSAKFVAGGPSKRSGQGRRPLLSWVVGDEIRRSALEAELETSAQRLSARTSFLSPPSSQTFSAPAFFLFAMVVARMDEKNMSLCYAMRNPPRGVERSQHLRGGRPWAGGDERGSASRRRKLGVCIPATWTSHPSAGSNAQDRVWPARAQRRARGPHVHPLSSHSAPGSFF